VTVLIEDTPRNNLASWTSVAADRRLTGGAVLSPFTTPVAAGGWKQSAQQTADRVRGAGVPIWLDATTHALQMSGVGDFRYYDGWELWGGNRGQLDDIAEQREHVRRVFAAQEAIGAPKLTPTVLLHAPQSETSERALQMGRLGAELEPNSYLSIAGTQPFWASGRPLDAHIGSLAQINAAGWFLTVVRPLAVLPPAVDVDEVFGLCRTVRSLSEYGPVHISFGDLAALPALAAGAQSIGTGWDVRQRVCAFPSYGARDPDQEGGGWFKRPTIQGLAAVLPRADSERLQQQMPAAAHTLIPGPLPANAPQEAFLHHLECLNRFAEPLVIPDRRMAFDALTATYQEAADAWPAARDASGCSMTAADWVTPLQAGLHAFGHSEGWV
jgi:hypothetical protein